MSLLNRIYKNKEFMDVASPILENEEFTKTKEIFHHGDTRYNHSVRVAYVSYLLSKGLGFDTKSVIRAGTLHDFFLERDDKNIATLSKMFINHPSIAKENAMNYFDLNEKEQNIIESHKFPISSVAPKYKEAWIVSLSDKIVAFFEGTKMVKSYVSVWILFLINFIR